MYCVREMYLTRSYTMKGNIHYYELSIIRSLVLFIIYSMIKYRNIVEPGIGP